MWRIHTDWWVEDGEIWRNYYQVTTDTKMLVEFFWHRIKKSGGWRGCMSRASACADRLRFGLGRFSTRYSLYDFAFLMLYHHRSVGGQVSRSHASAIHSVNLVRPCSRIRRLTVSGRALCCSSMAHQLELAACHPAR